MKSNILLGLFFIGLFYSCEKNEIPPQILIPEVAPLDTLIFDGIVMRDANGFNLNSDKLEEHWRWTDTLHPLFDTIFESLGQKDYCLSIPSEPISVFPNPCIDVLFFQLIQIENAEKFHMVMMDRTVSEIGNVIIQEVDTEFFVLNMAEFKSDTFRIYYQLTFEGGCILEGFGDVIKSN